MQILIKNCLINCSQCCKYLTNNRLTNDRNEKMYKIFFPDGEERNNQANNPIEITNFEPIST